MIDVFSRRTTPLEQHRAGWGFLVRWVAGAHLPDGSKVQGVGITRKAAERSAIHAARARRKAMSTTRRRAVVG